MIRMPVRILQLRPLQFVSIPTERSQQVTRRNVPAHRIRWNSHTSYCSLASKTMCPAHHFWSTLRQDHPLFCYRPGLNHSPSSVITYSKNSQAILVDTHFEGGLVASHWDKCRVPCHPADIDCKTGSPSGVAVEATSGGQSRIVNRKLWNSFLR